MMNIVSCLLYAAQTQKHAKKRNGFESWDIRILCNYVSMREREMGQLSPSDV
jgi:hypothetical protein